MNDELEIEISNHYNIRRLKYWLNYSLSSPSLFFLGWFFHIAFFLLAGAAIIFTPFMLKILFEERRFGWSALFIFLVLAPTIIVFIFFNRSVYFHLLEFVPLAFYYFYCFLLRLMIIDWFDETVIPKHF